MYEMQRPRPVSRRRPADFSASFAPLDHHPGPATCQCSSRPDHRLAWDSPGPGGPGIPLRRITRGIPQSQATPSPSRAVAQSFLSPHDPGFPPRPRSSSFPFAEVAQSFLRAASLGVSPPPISSKFSLCRWLGGFPPCRGGSGFSLGQRPQNYPLPVARGFPRAGWLGVSSSPTASGFSLPEGSELPFAGWLGVSPLPWLGVSPSPVTVPVVGEFLRLSPWPHKGFGPAISRFFGRPQAIHS